MKWLVYLLAVVSPAVAQQDQRSVAGGRDYSRGEDNAVKRSALRELIGFVDRKPGKDYVCVFINVATNEVMQVTNGLTGITRVIRSDALARRSTDGANFDAETGEKGVVVTVTNVKIESVAAECDGTISWGKNAVSVYRVRLQRSSKRWSVTKIEFKMGA